MKVIFLRDVPKMGRKYEVKLVADGYAKNFLLPKKLAAEASGSEVRRLEKMRSAHGETLKVQEDLLAKNIGELEAIEVRISRKANDKGSLFDGINTREISLLLEEQHHISIDPEYMDLERPLKHVGEHLVPVSVGGKSANLKVVIDKE